MLDQLVETDGAEIKFTFFYCMFSFWSSGVLVLVCVLSEGVAAFGSVLHRPSFLLVAAAYELGKVWLARLLSAHPTVLLIPWAPPFDSKPIRGPVLRKLCIQLGRVWARARPLVRLVWAATILAAAWAILLYITVCFGAPVTSHWSETGTFCCLLVLLTVYPALLIRGTSWTALNQIYLPADEELASRGRLDTALYLNSLLSLVGAWAGAVPIPLDWDTPWQVWPVPCCLAAVAGHLAANVWSAGSVWPHVAHLSSTNGGGIGSSAASKRKYV